MDVKNVQLAFILKTINVLAMIEFVKNIQLLLQLFNSVKVVLKTIFLMIIEFAKKENLAVFIKMEFVPHAKNHLHTMKNKNRVELEVARNIIVMVVKDVYIPLKKKEIIV